MRVFRDTGSGFILVWVEPDVYPLSRMSHEQIIVTSLLIHLVVRLVLIFVRLNHEKGVSDELTVVNAATDGAITMIGMEGRIVLEPFEDRINEISHGDLLGFTPNLKCHWVKGKLTTKALGTVVFVFGVGHAIIRTAGYGIAWAHFGNYIDHSLRFTVCTVYWTRIVGFIETGDGFTAKAWFITYVYHFFRLTIRATNRW